MPGYFGLLYFWMGGVGMPVSGTAVFMQPSHWYGPVDTGQTQAGYRSLLHFWLGGVGKG